MANWQAKKNWLWLIAIIIVMVVIGGIVYWQKQPGKLDSFAQCLGDKGAQFYGAFWCTHCQDQKAMFGRSAKLLPYIECSTSDGQNQTETCQQANIEGYPTWQFADGSREAGLFSLDQLAQKTGCQLLK